MNIGESVKTIRFQLVLILGDNLGLNGICGFVESFKANFCCRICSISSENLRESIEEDPTLLRSKLTYNAAIKMKNVSKTGIKEPCVFNEVNGFHITTNRSIDMMHDILEGVCKYVMRAIIFAFIFKEKYFTLDYLNYRIQNFEYGRIEISNKPSIIQLHKLKNKIDLNMSASEMLCLTRYFGLIIGDRIPEEDKWWELYVYLRQIIGIVTSSRIVLADIYALKSFVKRLNKLFIDLVGPLKPKFHFMVHYPRLLLENGPCIQYWSMRYESRHRQLKSNAVCSSCNINLLVTITKKQLLKMCHMFTTFASENPIKLSCAVKNDIVNSSQFFGEAKAVYYNSIDIYGTLYKNSMFIVTDMSKIEMEFGKIVKIAKIESELFFYLQFYEEITFDDHFYSYTVKKKHNKTQWFNYKNLPNVPPCLYVKNNKNNFVSTRFNL